MTMGEYEKKFLGLLKYGGFIKEENFDQRRKGFKPPLN
jgi:hypothetical protein